MGEFDAGDPVEMRKVLDKLKEIGPLTWEDLLEGDPAKHSDGHRRAIGEALETALKRYRGSSHPGT